MTRLNIIFAADSKYIPHLATAIKSILLNNEKNLFNIYIIHNSLKETDWVKIRSLDNQKNCIFINCKINDIALKKLPLKYHFTVAMYYRLLIPDLIFTDRALYFDSDIIVTNDLTELYSIDFKNLFLAAINDYGNHIPDYFNSGVMVLNLKAIRDNKIMEKSIEFIKNNQTKINFGDQDALNAIVCGRYTKLNPKFNVQSSMFNALNNVSFDGYETSKIRDAIKNPVVIHFTGSSKPWSLRNNHPYKSLYWKYRRLTPYRPIFFNDFTILELMKFIILDAVKILFNGIFKFTSGK